MERLHEDIRANAPSDIEIDVVTCRYMTRGIWRRVYDMIRAAMLQADVNHVVGDVHFLAIFMVRKKTILTIHDFIFIHSNSGLRRWLLWVFWVWLPVRRASEIVLVSESTRDQLLILMSCEATKLNVIHNFIGTHIKKAEKDFNKREPRILHIGVSPNKNLFRHIQAISGLSCMLVIIGRLSEQDLKHLRRHSINYENYVDLDDQSLLEQYYLSDIVLFASTYEGFGLPIAEANSVGRAVITSNCWSMPEVAGGAAALVDPFDVEDIRGAILRVIEDDGYRDQLIERGYRNAKRFECSAAIEKYSNLYRRVASNAK